PRRLEHAAKASPARTVVDRHPDLLGELAAANAEYLEQHGFEALVIERRGRSNLNPDVGNLNHPAAGYLDYLRKYGAPVLTATPPKTPEELQAAVDRGPHPSAKAHAEFLAQEAFEMCQRRHTMVLPFSAVKNLPGVEISPPGVIDQRDRRPRTISDLTYSGVNQSTVDLTANESMQFGRALRRILLNIYRADPRWGPVYMLKADISDGFYNIWVNANGSRRLGLILPSKPGEEPLVLFFLALPMGWVSSPPVFCTATEVATDVANKEIASNWRPPPHRQEQAADTEVDIDPTRKRSVRGKPPRIRHRNKGPLGYVDCYVDDFMALVQGSKRRRRRVRRVLFHCIDRVFRAPDDKDDEWAKDKISLKKLLKGDGALTTLKIILGWLVDTVAGTIELPPHRVERLFTMLDSFPVGRKTCPKRDLHKLIGELRSMLIAIPGGVGCISWLQETLKTAGERVYLNKHFHDAVADFRWLANDISNRPTRIAEVVPEVPAVVGMSDAAGPGMGGVWLPDGAQVYLASLKPSLVPALDTATGESVTAAVDARDACAGGTGLPPAVEGALLSEPILWRHPFPDDIQAELVSDSNPGGSINNSELELAGVLAHNDILANYVDVQETTTATGTDNTSGLGWSTKGAISATTPASYLLRLNSMHQRKHRYQQRNFYMPGVTNKMADDCSRLWNLSDDELVAYFNSTYPQNKCWRMCRLDADTASAIHSALRCERQPLPETLDALKAAPTPTTDGSTGAPRTEHRQRRCADYKLPQDLVLRRPSAEESQTDPRPSLARSPAHRERERLIGDVRLGAPDVDRFLLPRAGRPGEYCAARSGNKYFRLSDVQLLNHGHNLDLWLTPEETSDQKNHHRGEKVGQKASGHPTASPTVAIADQVCHLRAHGATPATPLCAFKEGTTWFVVTSTMITALLREAVAACPECGITPADVSARSLRASGAMAMLCDGLDTDHIKLFGRWRSDELLTYLHGWKRASTKDTRQFTRMLILFDGLRKHLGYG
ncbi:hypothetical protein THAOC_14776, partial [Thalassiosira oceanica]